MMPEKPMELGPAEELIKSLVDAAIAEEREECAKLVETFKPVVYVPRRPTIQELEKILQEDATPVEILPNGEVRAGETIFDKLAAAIRARSC
jgi:hypothetical protein